MAAAVRFSGLVGRAPEFSLQDDWESWSAGQSVAESLPRCSKGPVMAVRHAMSSTLPKELQLCKPDSELASTGNQDEEW